MKYIIIIGDGMGDYPVDELGGRTPLEAANIPNMDMMAREGTGGTVRTIPSGFAAGSDVANLSILGYAPEKFYTGRSPLEAAAMGVELLPDDVSFRCNLVTLGGSDDGRFMDDFSAGHITTEESVSIIRDIDKNFSNDYVRFYPGVSYRHLMVWHKGSLGVSTTPPHDITGKTIKKHLPHGDGAHMLNKLMLDTREFLEGHPVNKERTGQGKKPANSLWLWGGGKAPFMPTFNERFSLKGSVISAVDLIKGIGIYAGFDVVDVPGVTGYIDTNYSGKAEYALKALEEKDMVAIHVEAPDEAAHSGDLEAKIKAIEDIDKKIVWRILEGRKGFGECRVLLLCDHYTPTVLKTHTNEPVPFVIFPAPIDYPSRKTDAFNERALKNGIRIDKGDLLMKVFLS